jgi:hypothetical protein
MHKKRMQLDPSRENPVLRKLRLQDQIKMAGQQGKPDDVKRLTDELKALEATLSSAAPAPAPSKDSAPGTPSSAWAAVNERNRKVNLEQQRKAELAALDAKRKAEAAGAPVKLDPSARVKTNVRIMYDVRWVLAPFFSRWGRARAQGIDAGRQRCGAVCSVGADADRVAGRGGGGPAQVWAVQGPGSGEEHRHGPGRLLSLSAKRVTSYGGLLDWSCMMLFRRSPNEHDHCSLCQLGPHLRSYDACSAALPPRFCGTLRTKPP